jgi:hypothetical protein
MSSLSANKNKTIQTPTLKVSVTSEIIEAAKKRDSSHCAVAAALKKAYPRAVAIAVDLQTVRFSDPGKRVRYFYLTPRSAQVALVNFDQGVTPQPFEYTLRSAHTRRMYERADASKQKKQQNLPFNGLSGDRDAEPAPRPEPQAASQTQKASTAMPLATGLEKGARASLQSRCVNPSTSDRPPRRVGGMAPPLGNFARRREFGLRVLKR